MTQQIVEDGAVVERQVVAPAPRDTGIAQISTPPDSAPTPQRVLSYFLQQAGAKTVYHEGVAQSRFSAISEMMVSALMTGKISTTDETGEPLLLSSSDWLRLAKMVMDHLDGPATREIRVSDNPLDSIQVQAVQFYIPENGRRRTRADDAAEFVEGSFIRSEDEP